MSLCGVKPSPQFNLEGLIRRYDPDNHDAFMKSNKNKFKL